MKCKIDGCERNEYAAGVCSAHYQRKRNTGSYGESEIRKIGPDIVVKRCSEEGCDEKHFGKGFCRKHYKKYIGSKRRYEQNKNPFSKRKINNSINEHNRKVKKKMFQLWLKPTVYRGHNSV